MKVTYTELKGKQEAGYGVTRWANAQEINQSLKELTSKPIYSVTEEAYKDICENYYDKQCAKSKAITAEVYPRRRSAQPCLQQAFPDVYGQGGRRLYV